MGAKLRITGQRFGRLTAIAETSERRSGMVIWQCQCDCGSTVYVRGHDLVRGNTRSCGCMRADTIREVMPFITRHRLPPGVVAFRALYRQYRIQAEARGKSFHLTSDEFSVLVQGSCYYCGIEPFQVRRRRKNELTYNGIDRKDNKQGYSIDNCVSCCPQCNYGKKTVDHDQFIAWVRQVAKHTAHLVIQDVERSNVNAMFQAKLALAREAPAPIVKLQLTFDDIVS